MKKDLTRRITNGWNVPPEALRNVPVGTFRGREELCVENHCGILAYGEDCIRIAVKRGAVVIHGRDLSIANMSRCTLCVRGVITMIELE